MTPRIRKIIGGLGIMAFLAGYIWLVTAIADLLPEAGPLKLIFFAVTGLAWGLPILPLISWMDRGGKN